MIKSDQGDVHISNSPEANNYFNINAVCSHAGWRGAHRRPWGRHSRAARDTNVISAAFVIAMMVSCWPVPEAVIAQTKTSVPKPQNTVALAEDAVKDLLFLVQPDKNGKISKQAWMRFMGEEFDRLDKDKKGELDAQELRLSRPIKHLRAQDLGK